MANAGLVSEINEYYDKKIVSATKMFGLSLVLSSALALGGIFGGALAQRLNPHRNEANVVSYNDESDLAERARRAKIIMDNSKLKRLEESADVKNYLSWGNNVGGAGACITGIGGLGCFGTMIGSYFYFMNLARRKEEELGNAKSL